MPRERSTSTSDNTELKTDSQAEARRLFLWQRLLCFRRLRPRPPRPPRPRRRTFLSELAAGAGLLATLILLTVLFIHTASVNANTASEDERTEDESPNLDDPLYPAVERDPDRRAAPPRNHFSLHPADPGAWSFEDLNDEEKAEVEAAQTWAELEHGAAVHSAFSELTRKRSREARAIAAERSVGLEGLAGVGVAP